MHKITRCLALALACSTLSVLAGSFTPQKLRCEHLTDPLGIDTDKPRLSWILDDGRAADAGANVPRGVGQSAYRVLVASSQALLAKEAEVGQGGQGAEVLVGADI